MFEYLKDLFISAKETAIEHPVATGAVVVGTGVTVKGVVDIVKTEKAYKADLKAADAAVEAELAETPVANPLEAAEG